MWTVRPLRRNRPCCQATYSGALPTPGIEATVIEAPVAVGPDADEKPGNWQPASSTAAAAHTAAIGARPACRRWAVRPVGPPVIRLQVIGSNSRSSGHNAL